MRDDKLLESFSELDPGLIESSERKAGRSTRRVRYAALAASAALIIGGLAALPRPHRWDDADNDPTPPVSDVGQPSDITVSDPADRPATPPDEPGPDVPDAPSTGEVTRVELFFNDVPAPEGYSMEMPCIFAEELTEDELESVRGLDWPAGPEVTGLALYFGEGDLYSVRLEREYEDWDSPVVVNLWPQGNRRYGDCMFVIPEERETLVDSMGLPDCTAYRVQYPGGNVTLAVDFTLGETELEATLNTDPDHEERAREIITDAVSGYLRNAREGVWVDLTCLEMHLEHQFIDEEYDTLDRARADATFGAYAPASAPAGMAVSVQRWMMEDGADYMSIGFDSGGYDYLRLLIQRMDQSDSDRVVDITKPEQYDLSLYPIPMCDSVPPELREIVGEPIFKIEDLTEQAVLARTRYVSDSGDTSGPRTDFTVLYPDGVTVYVDSKGVDPGWIYDTLMSLGGASE